MNTKAHAVNATMWSAIDLFSRQFVMFAVAVVLARILTPADFGLIALLNLFTTIWTLSIQGGIFAALVQPETLSSDEKDTTFWLNLAASAAFAVLLVIVAPMVATFFGHAVLRPLMYVASGHVVISAMGSVHIALLSRELRFDQLAKVGIAASAVAGSASVVAALLGAGVWALAVQLGAMAVVYTFLLWFVSDWRPSRRFSLPAIRNITRFGGWVSLSTALEVLYTHGFAALLGKLHGVQALGLYSRAASVQLLPSSSIAAIISRVALPIFSQRVSDLPALQRSVQIGNRIVTLINLPIMIGLALFSDLVIEVLFGEQWTESSPVLSVLAIGGIFLPISAVNLHVLLATRRAGTFFFLETAKKVVAIACIAVGSFYGIMGLAYAQVIFGIFAFGINLRISGAAMNYGLIRQLADISDVVFATAIMAMGALLISNIVSFSPLVDLALIGTGGAILFFLSGLALRLPSFVDALSIAPLLIRAIRREDSTKN